MKKVKLPRLSLSSIPSSPSSRSKTWRDTPSASERKITTQVVATLPAATPPPSCSCGCRETDPQLNSVREYVRDHDLDINQLCALLQALEPVVANTRLRLRDFCVERAKRYVNTWAVGLAEDGLQFTGKDNVELYVPLSSEFYRKGVSAALVGGQFSQVPNSPRAAMRVATTDARATFEKVARETFSMMLAHLTNAKAAALINMRCSMPDKKDNARFISKQHDETYLDEAWEWFCDAVERGNGQVLRQPAPPPTLRQFETTADVVAELKHLMLHDTPGVDLVVVTEEDRRALDNFRKFGDPFRDVPPPMETRHAFGALPDPKINT